VQLLALAGIELGISDSLLAVAGDGDVRRLLDRVLQTAPDQRGALVDRWIGE
jgi:hypothetical protein